MASSASTLNRLRREIDQIDDDIHDLLMRRTAVVEQIRGTKGGDSTAYLRPAREALILRRLIKRHRGSFPKPALVRIWREIMAALVCLQGPLRVAVFAPEEYPGYWDLARDQFGASTPMTAFATVGQVMRAVSEGATSVGVLPWPHESSPDPWWRHLASREEDPIRIAARLPFAGEGDGRAKGLHAVAVARMAQERTGDDRSLLIIETKGEVSRSRFVAAMQAAGFDPSYIAEWQDNQDPNSWLHLIEIGDFVSPEDPRVGRLVGSEENAIVRAIQAGGYAVPLDEAELEDPGARGA